MEIKEKQKIYILFGIFGIAGFLLYYNLLLRPLFLDFIVKNREFYALRDRVRKENVLIANESLIRQQYDNIKKQAGDLEKKLPSQDQVSSLLEAFSSIAESSAVKILKLKPLENAPGAGKSKNSGLIYNEFPILLEARAGYHQLGYFVNKIENMDRFIKIIDVDIKGSDKDFRHHDIKLNLMAYVLQ